MHHFFPFFSSLSLLFSQGTRKHDALVVRLLLFLLLLLCLAANLCSLFPLFFLLSFLIFLRLSFQGALVSTTNVDCDLKSFGFDYLVRKMYEDNYGLSYRRNILLVVQDAARSLSSMVEEDDGRVMGGSTFSPASSSSSSSVFLHNNKNILLPLRFPCGTVTKQFQRKKSLEMSENRFGPICSRVFYPLVARFDVRTKQLDLIGRDCLLLVELVRTLAMVLE
jgi:hypothetical protein